MVDCLRQHRSAADEAVDHMAWRLAGPESGHPGALGDVAVGGGEMSVDLVGRDLDLEDHLRARLRSRGYGDQVSSSVAMVGEARFDLARLATPAPKAGASAVPPLARMMWCGGSALSLPMHRCGRWRQLSAARLRLRRFATCRACGRISRRHRRFGQMPPPQALAA